MVDFVPHYGEQCVQLAGVVQMSVLTHQKVYDKITAGGYYKLCAGRLLPLCAITPKIKILERHRKQALLYGAFYEKGALYVKAFRYHSLYNQREGAAFLQWYFLF